MKIILLKKIEYIKVFVYNMISIFQILKKEFYENLKFIIENITFDVKNTFYNLLFYKKNIGYLISLFLFCFIYFYDTYHHLKKKHKNYQLDIVNNILEKIN